MNTLTIYNSNIKPNEVEKEKMVNFLYTHLGEYGDPKKHILKCLDYAIGDLATQNGGFALAIKNSEDQILGATIINETGMSGYIPENILVYIAVNKDSRGQGIGKQLMQKAIELTEGDIALHVEPDNPAKKLYEKLGFTNKYLEMRLSK